MNEPTQEPKRDYMLPASIMIAALLISVSLVYNAGKKPPADNGDGGLTPTQENAPQVVGDWSFTKSDPAIGPADAKITVVEFADFQCPYCGIVYGRDLGGTRFAAIRGTATNVINEYAKTGKVRFVYHIMSFLGQESVDAANAALCAREIGGDEAFFKMHDVIFDNQKDENNGNYSKANLKKMAATAGFNSEGMMSCIESGKFYGQVEESDRQANAVGVASTPTFAINNVVNTTIVEYAKMKQAIDAALNK